MKATHGSPFFVEVNRDRKHRRCSLLVALCAIAVGLPSATQSGPTRRSHEPAGVPNPGRAQASRSSAQRPPYSAVLEWVYEYLVAQQVTFTTDLKNRPAPDALRPGQARVSWDIPTKQPAEPVRHRADALPLPQDGLLGSHLMPLRHLSHIAHDQGFRGVCDLLLQAEREGPLTPHP